MIEFEKGVAKLEQKRDFGYIHHKIHNIEDSEINCEVVKMDTVDLHKINDI